MEQRQPINPRLNQIVAAFASRTLPWGFDVSYSAPNTWHEVRDQLAYGGRLSIWAGDFGKNSAFADDETWRAFRAWHDYIHVRYDMCFSPRGEWATAAMQSLLFFRNFGKGPDVLNAAAVMWAEQIDPLERDWAGRPAIDDRHPWVAKRWPSWLPVVHWLSAQDCWTDPACKALALQLGSHRESLR